MEAIALEAVGVSKSFGTRAALSSVGMVARRGQLHGLLGPNGAGKTTLMRVLLGLVRRDAGTVRLLGHEVGPVLHSIPDGVAGMVEAPAFYPYLSGRRNLALLARLDGATADARRNSVDSVLEQTGLTKHAEFAVSSYSTGMRQRLGLAAALLRSPGLLFLDEPTSSLDPGAARDVRVLAQRLANEGTAIVFSSHDMTEVEELCSVVTIINDGRLVFSGTVDEVRKRAPSTVHALRTNDDDAALKCASNWPAVRATAGASGGLDISANVEALDAYIIALGRAGIAVRGLERRVRSLESLFLDLTAHGGDTLIAVAPPIDAPETPVWQAAS
jgi:ABC-2 type transport system ATP-binding protein